MTCREIETLMMCYVDALRRGKLIAGILGAISGKLAILETRGLPCKRYQAVGILLAVWHTVGYSSRRMYFGTPSTSGPDALYSALDTKDPTILAMCIFTYNLDKMCRRYCQNGETYVPPESIEFTRVIAASYPEPLPKAQLRLLSSLDSFLLALNFAYNQSLTALPSIEALERQRHQLHSIVNDADSSDLLNLLVGPHVLAMASCAALYCLAACQEKGETETDADQKQNIRTLERDYLSILDALRNMTTALSATPDASLINSHPFADGGDMRLLYAQIANFVKVNLAAAISSSKEQLTASQVIGNLHSMGYLGTVLAASKENNSGSV
ncbi:hypothetical protein P389DRAFT_173709 [Cystobasidium minutum MCA 4210]|uniref:uncharacterized protein n=1 Tax=Cystobasidium minutum MCA 4210 TaxID=1397322 RepID=UPI0034CDA60A|eukprot:jgi/Rhomi1/173709/fgenesh1_kg.6_\